MAAFAFACKLDAAARKAWDLSCSNRIAINMGKNPYRPPSGGDASKAGTAREGFFELIAAVLAPIFAVAWGIALLFGWGTDSVVLFHLIYASLVLIPSIAITVFAFTGRSKFSASSGWTRIGNVIGTICFLLVGFSGCVAYAVALFYR